MSLLAEWNAWCSDPVLEASQEWQLRIKIAEIEQRACLLEQATTIILVSQPVYAHIAFHFCEQLTRVLYKIFEAKKIH